MNGYTDKTAREIEEQHLAVQIDLQNLMLECVRQGQQLTEPLAQEHLVRGSGRRLRTLARSSQNIFALFPISTQQPLPSEALSDVQIQLHAFLINLYGLFENFGWAFVLRHGLLDAVGGRMGVGLFNARTQKFLPKALREYFLEAQVQQWHAKYLKSYRDALAHRIPPYVPPATFTPEQGQRFNELSSEEVEAIKAQDWGRIEEARAEKQNLGQPSWAFLHAFTEADPPRPIMLHGQVVTDGMTVAEAGKTFLTHWHSLGQVSS